MQAVTSSPCQYVQEWDDPFLLLFPHRYNYIWAEPPDLKDNVAWKTENRHPLSDRLIQQGAYLYGVRFGAETSYCLLDIDIGSSYHPQQDPFAIVRLVAALEPLGLVSYVVCTSSGCDLNLILQDDRVTILVELRPELTPSSWR